MYPPWQDEGIFVIHSECDNVILDELENFFKEQCYFDVKDKILTNFIINYVSSKKADYVGKDYSDLIKEKFQECHYYLIIITEKSKESVWVNQEIGYALAIDEDRCLVMVDDRLEKKSFGFIHTNYFVEYFTYDNFKISENGDEIKNIIRTIEDKFGGIIPKSKLEKTTDEIITIYYEHHTLKYNRGKK